ncbi:ABC transporter ATP-binding protein [Spirosoma arcticum]
MALRPEDGLSEKEFTRKRALLPFLKRLFGYSLRYRRWVVGLVTAGAVEAIIDAIFPLIWLRFIDQFIVPEVARLAQPGNQPIFTDHVWQQFGLFAVIYGVAISIQAVSVGFVNHFSGRISEYVIFDLRTDMFTKLQQLPYAFYDRSAIGWLLVRLTADVDKVANVISEGFVTLIVGMILILASLVAMFSYSWQLTLIVLFIMPLLVVSSTRIRLLMLGFTRQAKRFYSVMAAFLTEHINGIEVNKATVQEGQASADFRDRTDQLRQSAYKAALYASLYNPVIIVIGSVAAASVLYRGGLMLFGSMLSIGMLAAFFAYARSILEPILDLTRYYAATQDSLSAGERIFSLIDEPVTIADQPGAVELPKLHGDIRFENVSFHYKASVGPTDKPVINDLNLTIRAGESIALVGPTGEGKTTLMSLICRFYEPTAGQLLVDGQDYRHYTLRSYRQRLGIILQTTYLFSGTVRDNVRYGRQDATDDQIQAALQSIGADEFVDRLDEEVGEEGSRLSAGEKQLLSFARTILKDPDVLLMDEATSSLDTLAEQKIQRGIQQLTSGRTSIIIAHRLSTVRHCDRILMVNRGSILEDGSHEQLMKKHGFYHDLYTRQLRKEMPNTETLDV